MNSQPKNRHRKFRRAVGLRYREVMDATPTVSVKGDQAEADYLVRLAERYRIPVVENRELAQALGQLEIDQEIPESLYEAAAIVLSKLAAR